MRDRRERRQKERCELSLAMQVWPTNAPRRSYKALTVNLNAAGVQFALTSRNPEDFRPGASLRFYIELADAPYGARCLVVGTGRVVRVDPGRNAKVALIITTWRFVRRTCEVPQLRMVQYAS
jgi:hypothetical protein